MPLAWSNQKRPAEERFWEKVEQRGECWVWTKGALNAAGYGVFASGGQRHELAHRWSYEQLIGEVPTGLQLDHLCRVRACVNPWHLDPVTPQVNTYRGLAGKPNANRGKHHGNEHCRRGHALTAENTYVRGRRDGNRTAGCRECRTCHREDERARQQRRRLVSN